MSAAVPPPPPILPAPHGPISGFHWRNWWRNGWRTRLLVFLAVLTLLNLFQPWEPDISGYGYTERTVSAYAVTTHYHAGTEMTGRANAFGQKRGWLPLGALLALLYVCGRPRREQGGLRWVPVGSGVVLFFCALVAMKSLERDTEAWRSTFSTPPQVFYPPAINWVIIFSVPITLLALLLARAPQRPKEDPVSGLPER